MADAQLARFEYDSVPDTLDRMAQMVREARTDPLIRDRAAAIVRGIDSRDGRRVATAVWRYVRRHIDYVLDPNDTEMIAAPAQTLKRGYGDCDDHAMLAAALLQAVGYPTIFRAVAQRQRGDYDHVYVAVTVDDNGNTWALDTTRPTRPGPDTFAPRAHSVLDHEVSTMQVAGTNRATLSRPRRSLGATNITVGGSGPVATGAGPQSTVGQDDPLWARLISQGLNNVDDVIRALRNQGQQITPEVRQRIEQALNQNTPQTGGFSLQSVPWNSLLLGGAAVGASLFAAKKLG